MWTETTRKQYERQSARYASDLTDGEWALIAPHLPAAKPIGRPRTTVLREVINALFYLLSTGCQWRMLPKEFPPRSTVHRYFTAWREDGTWSRIHHALTIEAREREGRRAHHDDGHVNRRRRRRIGLQENRLHRFIRRFPDDLHIRGNYTTISPPRKMHTFRSHRWLDLGGLTWRQLAA